MYQTKGAIGNLLNRYRAVLKKCHLLNTFGSLAVAGMLVMGGVGVAGAAEGTDSSTGTETTTPQYGGAVLIIAGETKDFTDRDFTGESAPIGGGAIYNGGTVYISGGTFSGNKNTTAYQDNEPNKDNLAGGAIFNTGKLYVSGTTFDSNESTLKAGAIFNRKGEVYIENGTFTKNHVPFSMGGAILNESGTGEGVSTIYIKSSKFDGNESGNGGAVWNGSSAVLYIGGTDSDRTLFSNNEARASEDGKGAQQGGAITNAGEMYIAYTDFKGNTAEGNGGAVANVDNANIPLESSEISISNVTFTGNKAGKSGGAIYNATDTAADTNAANNIVLDTVTIKDNTAGTAGGGIYNAANSNIVFTGDNTITGNGIDADKDGRINNEGEYDDVYTLGNVTIASGTTTIGVLTIANDPASPTSKAANGTGSVTVGGEGYVATLEVTEELKNSGSLTVKNLGVMSIDAKLLKGTTGDYANVADYDATVNAGGKYEVTGLTSPLDSSDLTELAKLMSEEDSAGLIKLTDARFEEGFFDNYKTDGSSLRLHSNC